LNLKSVNGFDGFVTLSCGGGPARFVCVDLPMQIRLDGRATAATGVVFARNTPAGTYTITFTGTSWSTTESVTVQFTVE